MTNAAAQLMLKYGMLTLGPISFSAETLIQRIFQIVFNPRIFAGLLTFVISMASHLYVLSKVDLSFAYPFLSLAYVAVALFAAFVQGGTWRLQDCGNCVHLHRDSADRTKRQAVRTAGGDACEPADT